MGRMERARRACAALDSEQLDRLTQWIERRQFDLVLAPVSDERDPDLAALEGAHTPRPPITRPPRDGRETFRQEGVRCGRANCRCAQGGPRHGPYWYAVRRDMNGRVRKRYIGRELPPEIDG